MPPDTFVSCVDFAYITDALTPAQALEILRVNQASKAAREEEMRRDGFPAYTTSAGWLGDTDDQLRKLCQDAIAEGWTHFKIKVRADIDDDIRLCTIIRQEIGHRKLMIDANQPCD